MKKTLFSFLLFLTFISFLTTSSVTATDNDDKKNILNQYIEKQLFNIDESTKNVAIYRNGKLFCTDVTINGRKMTFLIDTGASWTLIDESTFNSLKGNSRFKHILHNFYAIDEATIDHIKTSNMVIAIFDLSKIKNTLDREFSGIIGGTFFRNFIVTLDFQNQKMSIGKKGPNLENSFSIKIENNTPHVNAKIDGMDFDILIDTGNGYRGIVASENNFNRLFLLKKRKYSGVTGTNFYNEIKDEEFGIINHLKIFNRARTRVICYKNSFPFETVSIGLPSIENNIVVIDYLNKKIHFVDLDSFDFAHNESAPFQFRSAIL